MRCTHCTESIPRGSVVCPFCATPVADAPTTAGHATPGDDTRRESRSRAANGDGLADAATSLTGGQEPGSAAAAGAASRPRRSVEHGRFLPGTMVDGRYRVVGLLGRGGMGEVYRADDLKLGQQVALKFLPERIVAGEEDVRRLLDEVRTAREVSHPNVCRVFDIGETGGQHYVSMEYVDGEDLSSLLRRIGRLPEDKALEIARQLCAALAAAHEEGILHRDLKPANIMLDGRGRVKLTDFGLAAVAEIRAGTPVYMAPEQLAGTEVSVRSDVYSLGVVLYELFTGRRVFEADDLEELSRLHDSGTPTSLPDSGRLDPAIDRAIRRCLERDPADRPQSALAVAAALPGADPLAAALAAGETPSPEMVAEAGGEGTLSPLVAGALLLLSLACATAVGVLRSDRSLVSLVPFEMSPALLEARAVEVVEELGLPDDHADTASAFGLDLAHATWLRQNPGEPGLDVLTSGRSGTVHFWWRGSPRVMVRTGDDDGVGLATGVTLSDPPRTTPGMVSVQLDTVGRLLWLDVVPERVTEAEPGAAPASPADWAAVFELMGLEMASFEPVLSRLTPPHFADERVAWEGAFPEDPSSTVRIEAAAYRGTPVSLRRFTPANPLQPARSAPAASSGGMPAVVVAFVSTFALLLLTVVFGSLFVARRNVRSGRGDARGARRLGFAVACGVGAAWVLGEHALSLTELNAFIEMLIFVGAFGGMTWALYLAVEPFMRRQAPEGLIGWTRIVDGQWADPLVARDLLLGCAAGALSLLLSTAPKAMAPRLETIDSNVALPPASMSELLSAILGAGVSSVMVGLAIYFLYGLSFLLLGRRRWLTYAAWLLLLGGVGFIPGLTINLARPAATLTSSIFWALGWALWLYVLFRLGLLTFAVMSTVAAVLHPALPALDLSAWYAQNTVTALAVFAALALWATYRCVEWKGGLAEALGGEAG